MAFQTLYNEGTCEAFKASNPLCFGEGHGADSGRCPGAALFQLVMDRNRDLDRTYMGHDFRGVARNLYKDGSVFADSAFETDIANLYKNWSSSQVSVQRVPRSVLKRNVVGSNSSTWVLHEVGSWVEGDDVADYVARYTRWSYSGNPFGWQIETDVDLRETENKNKPSNYTDAIRERYAVYNAMYEAGNYSGLVADLYTSDAVLALTSGSFVEHDSLEHSFSLWSRNFSVSVAVGEEGADVVHDIGLSVGFSTVPERYYARWEKCGDEWKIAVHAHSGPRHLVQGWKSEAHEDNEDREEGNPGLLVA